MYNDDIHWLSFLRGFAVGTALMFILVFITLSLKY